jgi:nitrogen regulatory protein P-II 2
MHTTTLTKVTIIAEEVLEGRLTELVKHEGATGFTVTPCRGEGSRGLRIGSMPGGNVRIEVLVPASVSESIVARLAEDYFTNYAVIAWLTEVSVLRGEKYVRPGA